MVWMVVGVVCIVLGASLIVGLILLRKLNPPGSLRLRRDMKIPGIICHWCQSTDVYWAGYADRKQCGQCGKIL